MDKVVDVTRWEPPSREWVKINFDAAFDRALFNQGQGLLPEMEEEGWFPLDQLYTRMLARLLQRRPSPSFGAAEELCPEVCCEDFSRRLDSRN